MDTWLALSGFRLDYKNTRYLMFRWPLHVLLSLTDTEASPWRLRHSRRRANCISDTLESEPSKVVLLVGVRGFLPWGWGDRVSG